MVNRVILHGYLGRDPELTEQTGQKGPYKKATFTLGVGRDFGDETDWFYCVVYGNRAEVLEKWFRKGSQIIVYGRMESYKPKNDPNRTAWLVRVDGFDFCDKKQTAPAGSETPTIPNEPDDEEDIPF